jgi:hypothetical protein
MKNLNLTVLFLLGSLAQVAIACGCCPSVGSDPVALFRLKHPKDWKKYSYISPANTELCDVIFNAKSLVIYEIGDSLKEKFANPPEIAAYGDRIVAMETKARTAWKKTLDELHEAKAKGGTICQFEWSDGITKETGLLVVSSGEISKRAAWSSEPVK